MLFANNDLKQALPKGLTFQEYKRYKEQNRRKNRDNVVVKSLKVLFRPFYIAGLFAWFIWFSYYMDKE